MPVTMSDKDFNYIYDTFEKMMSPWSTHEELVESMKNENRIWERLQQIKGADDRIDQIPSTTPDSRASQSSRKSI